MSETIVKLQEKLMKDGYVVIPSILSKEEIARIKEEFEPLLKENPKGRNPFEGFETKRVYALFNKVRCLDGMATHPVIMQLVKGVLGEYFQLSSTVGIQIAPGEKQQLAHRDDGKYPFEKLKDVIVNTMWAIDDFTFDNGATVIYPNTKMQRNLPDTAPSFPAVMKSGDVLVYLGSIWHSGGENRSKAPRFGILLEYVVSWIRPQENHSLAVDKKVAMKLKPELQELLGYNVHPPFIGYVDGRHPIRMLSSSL